MICVILVSKLTGKERDEKPTYKENAAERKRKTQTQSRIRVKTDVKRNNFILCRDTNSGPQHSWGSTHPLHHHRSLIKPKRSMKSKPSNSC